MYPSAARFVSLGGQTTGGGAAAGNCSDSGSPPPHPCTAAGRPEGRRRGPGTRPSVHQQWVRDCHEHARGRNREGTPPLNLQKNAYIRAAAPQPRLQSRAARRHMTFCCGGGCCCGSAAGAVRPSSAPCFFFRALPPPCLPTTLCPGSRMRTLSCTCHLDVCVFLGFPGRTSQLLPPPLLCRAGSRLRVPKAPRAPPPARRATQRGAAAERSRERRRPLGACIGAGRNHRRRF